MQTWERGFPIFKKLTLVQTAYLTIVLWFSHHLKALNQTTLTATSASRGRANMALSTCSRFTTERSEQLITVPHPKEKNRSKNYLAERPTRPLAARKSAFIKTNSQSLRGYRRSKGHQRCKLPTCEAALTQMSTVETRRLSWGPRSSRRSSRQRSTQNRNHR